MKHYVLYLLIAVSLFSCKDEKKFTGLPIVTIISEPIVSKDTYVDATVIVDGNSDYDSLSYLAQVKGRGNSTWPQPKKPYKIKLKSKAEIMGMPADKEWALLANHFDKTLLRNDIMFEIAERMDMRYIPKRRFVEVYLNKQYNGNYLMTELPKLTEDRVDSKFLFEVNARADEKQNWVTTAGVFISMKEPEELKKPQLDSVIKVIQDFENHLENYAPFNNQHMEEFIDFDEWAKWMITSEFTRNKDAVLFSSVFFYFNKDNKISLGPVWDGDLSAGAYVGSDSVGAYVFNTNPWFAPLMNTPEFRDKLKAIWNEKRDELETIPDYIEKMAKYLEKSQTENYNKWPYLNTQLYPDQYLFGNYNIEIEHLRHWYANRFKWLDTYINE